MAIITIELSTDNADDIRDVMALLTGITAGKRVVLTEPEPDPLPAAVPKNVALCWKCEERPAYAKRLCQRCYKRIYYASKHPVKKKPSPTAAGTPRSSNGKSRSRNMTPALSPA